MVQHWPPGGEREDAQKIRALYGLWLHYTQGHWPTEEDYYGYFTSQTLKRAMLTSLKHMKCKGISQNPSIESLPETGVDSVSFGAQVPPPAEETGDSLDVALVTPKKEAPPSGKEKILPSPELTSPQNSSGVPEDTLEDPSKPTIQGNMPHVGQSSPSSHDIPYTSLEDLRRAMEDFEGCALKHTATHLVFGEGNPKSSVMVLGEAPGRDEDAQGRPFVGESGKLLDAMLAYIGLSRQKNLYITNIIPWRPPGNRPPTPQEIQTMLPFVQAHIHLIQPQYVLLIGATACRSLLKDFVTMGRVRGQFFPYTLPWSDQTTPPQCFALYHPAYLLRAPLQKKVVWQDLLTFHNRVKSCI